MRKSVWAMISVLKSSPTMRPALGMEVRFTRGSTTTFRAREFNCTWSRAVVRCTDPQPDTRNSAKTNMHVTRRISLPPGKGKRFANYLNALNRHTRANARPLGLCGAARQHVWQILIQSHLSIYRPAPLITLAAQFSYLPGYP